MARKTSAPADPAHRLLDAALALAAEQPWEQVRLGDIAGRAKLPLWELHRRYRTKSAVLDALMTRVDEQILAAGPAEGETPRERLFDLLMRRFECLAPHRDALWSIARSGLRDPLALLCRGPRFFASMAWMLEAAGISAAGIGGRCKTRGLGLIVLRCLPVFLADESKDLAKTMACLDRALAGVETLAGRFLPDRPLHQKA